MSDSLLDPIELEAIQAAIRESLPRRLAGSLDVEATRLALIRDDRIAEAARPVLLGLGTRWIRSATRALRSHLPGTWQLDVVGGEVIDGATAKEELRGAWVGGLAAPAAADGDAAAELVLAAHGGVIDVAAAKRCGEPEPVADTSRPPSAVSLRLFQPAGRAMLDSFALAWREVFPTDLQPTADLGLVTRLIGAQTVIRIALSFVGAVTGRVQLYARPDFMIPRPAALAAIRATAQRIANALAHVEIEVVVELGTLRMPLRKIRNLEPGATFTLSNFIDSRVPVYCGGALKAWGRPVVHRGVLAVQIESVLHGQGVKA